MTDSVEDDQNFKQLEEMLRKKSASLYSDIIKLSGYQKLPSKWTSAIKKEQEKLVRTCQAYTGWKEEKESEEEIFRMIELIVENQKALHIERTHRGSRKDCLKMIQKETGVSYKTVDRYAKDYDECLEGVRPRQIAIAAIKDFLLFKEYQRELDEIWLE